MDNFDLDNIPWEEGRDPQNRRDREYKRKVKLSNRNKRQRKKKNDAINDFNASRPAGTLRKFYV